MDLLKVTLAGFGLSLAVYAAMETESEEVLHRAVYGAIGLGFSFGSCL